MVQRRGQGGQATVEYTAITVVVALLLGAMGLWVVRHAHPTERPPPPPVTRIVDPLVALSRDATRSSPGVIARGRRLAARGIGAAIRGSQIAARGSGAFHAGFVRGLRDAVTGLVRDPVGALTGGDVRAALRDPVGTGRALVAAASAYARELRSLPPDQAYVRLMGDAGQAGADLAISRGKLALQRALVRALKRRLDGPHAGVSVR